MSVLVGGRKAKHTEPLSLSSTGNPDADINLASDSVTQVLEAMENQSSYLTATETGLQMLLRVATQRESGMVRRWFAEGAAAGPTRTGNSGLVAGVGHFLRGASPEPDLVSRREVR